MLDRIAYWIKWHGWIGAGPRFTLRVRLPGLPWLWRWAVRRMDRHAEADAIKRHFLEKTA